MESLKTIQKVSKFGKVFCKIIFILCLVSLIIFLIAGLCVYLLPNDIELNKNSLSFLEANNLNFSKNSAYDTLAIASIGVITAMFVLKKAEDYFTFELQEGTPFTEESAKKIKELGIIVILAPIVATVVSLIVHAIIQTIFGDVGEIEFNYDVSVTMGFVFLFLSAVFKYGASLKENNKEEEK